MLDDNYGYLICDEEGKVAAAVDVVDPEAVFAAESRAGVSIETVLTTHNHWDHAGGNVEFASKREGVEIVGGLGDAAAGVTREVSHGDVIKVGEVTITVLATPCHTPGHVCYLAEDSREGGGPGAVFTGDTLFSSGCGKFNAGTAEQMHHALNTVLAGLPEATEVYNGHEYTLSNLKFAMEVEPDNADMAKKKAWAEALVAEGKSTLPSTIANELLTNPFMRVTGEAAKAYTGKEDPVEVMAELRRLKNEGGKRGK